METFLIKSLAACVFGGLVCGIIGVWVFLLNIPFVGVAMVHTSFAGAVFGLLVGINPVVAALIFCIISSFFIGPLAEKGNFSANLSTGIVFSFMLGLAFLLMGKLGSRMSEALSLMWGNILLVGKSEIIFLFLMTVLILFFLFAFNKGIIAMIYNRDIAFSCGIPERFIFYSLLILCAVTVSVNIKNMGALLIYGLITLPPAAASQITKKLAGLYVFSCIFSIFSCISGLGLSYLFDLPTGASIVVFSCVLLLCGMGYKKFFRR